MSENDAGNIGPNKGAQDVKSRALSPNNSGFRVVRKATPATAKKDMLRIGTRAAQIEARNKIKQKFLEAYTQTCTLTAAAKIAGVDRGTHYKWLKADKAYCEQFASTHETTIESLEAEARKRAFDGSDVLLIFLLKGARPEKYRERYEHIGKEGGPITVTFGGRYKPQ